MYGKISWFWKIFHLFPVMVVYLIIFSITYAFTKFFILDNDGIYFIKILISALFYTISVMVLICHFRATITSPGIVFDGWNNDLKNIYEISHQNNMLNENEKNLFCQKCSKKRPGRAHHCKICNQCILKMDHHCPWIANCVGHGNQKYFYTFLFYATIGDLIASIILIMKCCDINSAAFSNKTRYDNDYAGIIDSLILIFCTGLAISMTIGIGFLFVMQTRFIMYNSTTIECRKYSKYCESPYYYGDNLFNFKIVLGDEIYKWFIPIFKKNRYNNGFYFINRKNEINNNNFTSIKNVDSFSTFDNHSKNIQKHIELDDLKPNEDVTISVRENDKN